MKIADIKNPHLLAALAQKTEQRDTTFTDKKLLSDCREQYILQSARTTNGRLFEFRWARHILSA